MTEEAKGGGRTERKRPNVSPEKFRREKRRTMIERLYLTGLPMYRIAEELKAKGVPASKATVSREIESCRREWRERRIANMDRHVEEELARLGRLEAEAWTAWEESKKERVTLENTGEEETAGGAEVEPKDGKAPAPSRSRTRKKMRSKERREREVGEPRFLEIMVRVSQERSRILGNYAPKVRQIRSDEAMRQLAQLLSTGDEQELPPESLPH